MSYELTEIGTSGVKIVTPEPTGEAGQALNDNFTALVATDTALAASVATKAAASTLTAHTSNTSNPHATTAAQIGAATTASLSAHTSNQSNPHATTAAQVGAYTTAQTDSLLAGKSSTSHGHEGITNGYGYLAMLEGQATAYASGGLNVESQLNANALQVNTLANVGKLRVGNDTTQGSAAGDIIYDNGHYYGYDGNQPLQLDGGSSAVTSVNGATGDVATSQILPDTNSYSGYLLTNDGAGGFSWTSVSTWTPPDAGGISGYLYNDGYGSFSYLNPGSAVSSVNNQTGDISTAQILPDTNGYGGYVLTNDGAGNFSWTNMSSSPVTSVNGATGDVSTAQVLPTQTNAYTEYLWADGNGNFGWAEITNGPAGSSNEIQYNDNGAFVSSANLTFEGGTTLNVNGNIYASTQFRVGSQYSTSTSMGSQIGTMQIHDSNGSVIGVIPVYSTGA